MVRMHFVVTWAAFLAYQVTVPTAGLVAMGRSGVLWISHRGSVTWTCPWLKLATSSASFTLLPHDAVLSISQGKEWSSSSQS